MDPYIAQRGEAKPRPEPTSQNTRKDPSWKIPDELVLLFRLVRRARPQQRKTIRELQYCSVLMSHRKPHILTGVARKRAKTKEFQTSLCLMILRVSGLFFIPGCYNN
jgi:hypothetical protein